MNDSPLPLQNDTVPPPQGIGRGQAPPTFLNPRVYHLHARSWFELPDYITTAEHLTVELDHYVSDHGHVGPTRLYVVDLEARRDVSMKVLP